MATITSREHYIFFDLKELEKKYDYETIQYIFIVINSCLRHECAGQHRELHPHAQDAE